MLGPLNFPRTLVRFRGEALLRGYFLEHTLDFIEKKTSLRALHKARRSNPGQKLEKSFFKQGDKIQQLTCHLQIFKVLFWIASPCPPQGSQ